MRPFSYALYGGALALLPSCNPEKSSPALAPAFRQYDLGPITAQLPASWQAEDQDSTWLDPTRKGHQYLFQNRQSPDTVFREMIVFTVSHRKGKASFARVDRTLASTLAEGGELQQIRVRRFTDTLLTNPARELAIVELDSHSKAYQLDLLGTYGFYQQDSLLVTVIATGLRTPGASAQQKRALFQDVIHSIQCK